MKKLLLLLALPFSVFAQQGKEVKIKGKLKTDKVIDKVLISYRTGEETVRDSVEVKDGEFKYATRLVEPTLVNFVFKSNEVLVTTPRYGAKEYIKPVFIGQGDIDLEAKDSIQALKVKGSSAHTEYEALVKAQKVYDEELNKLYAAYSEAGKAKDTAGQQEIEKKIETVDARMRDEVYKTYVQKNPRSPVALWAVRQYAGYDIDAEKTDPIFALLPENVKAYPSAMAFKERIDIARKTSVGQYALDFTQNDTLGQPVSLSSFRGKYVLVDFWASWCGPCRKENPNIVKVFNTYKDRNFTVLGVSLDRPNAKDRWLKAIHDDNLTWTHVSDLKFWDNAVAKQYGIQAIPQNLLIDPQGKIIAKNVRGEELGKELEKIYTK